jgi:hypothetical protein
MADHERPLWLCQQHASEARASAEYQSDDNGHQAPAR